MWTQFPSDTGCSWWWWHRRPWLSWAPLTGQGGCQEHFHCRRSPTPHPAWGAAGRPSPGRQAYIQLVHSRRTWGWGNIRILFSCHVTARWVRRERRTINGKKVTGWDWGRLPLNSAEAFDVDVWVWAGGALWLGLAPAQNQGLIKPVKRCNGGSGVDLGSRNRLML